MAEGIAALLGCDLAGDELGDQLEVSSAAHDDLKLGEDAARVRRRQRDHPGPMLPDGGDLKMVFLDVPVTGDDQPTPGGYLWDPLRVLDRGRGD